jgi:predicted PurR-regulated permease PerM
MNPYIAWPRSAKVAAVLFMVIAAGFILVSAKEILIPIALAVLISFVLHPLVRRLVKWRVPRIMAVLLVVAGSTVVVGGVGFVVSAQLKSFADELPQYEDNVEQKLLAVRTFFKGGTIEKLTGMFRRIDRNVDRKLQESRTQDGEAGNTSSEPAEGDREPGAAQPERESTEPAEPMDNETAEAGSTKPAATAQAPSQTPAGSSGSMDPTGLTGSPLLSSAMNVLATSGIIILLVTFFLIQEADIRDRLVSVAGRGALATTTKALDEAGARISRYLLMLFVVNSTYGLAVAIGLFFMGVPYAIMWGLAAGAIRYVPYVGPWIGATLPIAVSLVTSEGWSQPFMVIGLFAALELISNNVMEPILYGHSVGLSELGVILAAIVWAWLWGPVGLVLATPMTVCFVVLGRHVPGLRIFDHLLGDQASVSPAVRLYQRLLSRSSEEGEELVREHLKTHSVAETGDELLIPAIELMRQDLAHEQIDDSDVERIRQCLNDIVDGIVADEERKAVATEACPPGSPGETPLVMGVAAHANEEALLLELLNAVCADTCCRIEVLSSDLLQSERLAAIQKSSPELVILSSLPPGDVPYTRQLCKRIKAQGAARRLVVARWGKAQGVDRSQQFVTAGADSVVSSLAELEPMVRTAFQILQTSRAAPASASGDVNGRVKAQAG